MVQDRQSGDSNALPYDPHDASITTTLHTHINNREVDYYINILFTLKCLFNYEKQKL